MREHEQDAAKRCWCQPRLVNPEGRTVGWFNGHDGQTEPRVLIPLAEG